MLASPDFLSYRVDTFIVYMVFAPSERRVYGKLRMRKVLQAPEVPRMDDGHC